MIGDQRRNSAYGLWAIVLMAGAMFPNLGCGTAAEGLRKPLDAINPRAPEAALRKQVEADSFPTAQEAGIH